MEAQRQIVDVAEDLAGEPPRRVLPDLLEHGVAQIVRQHAAEARRGVSRRPGRRRRANGAHGALIRSTADLVAHKGIDEADRLAGEHQQHRDDDARLELALALRPQHRQEPPQRREPAVRLLPFCAAAVGHPP